MKKIIMGLAIVGVLVVAVFIWQRNVAGASFSVHDLNWDYYEEMNERGFEVFYSNPPHVYDASLLPIGHMQELLRFFRDNQDLIRDSRQGDDLDFTLRLRNITGNEEFLGNIDWEQIVEEREDEILEIRFYFDRSLLTGFLEALNASNDDYVRAINPDAFNEERITLSEVDWDALRDDYESEISAILIQGGAAEDSNFDFDMARFESGRDDLSVILEFLEVNQGDFHSVENSEYTYQGTIHFWTDDDEPRLMSTFFMDEALNRRLMEAIGEEAWERALR